MKGADCKDKEKNENNSDGPPGLTLEDFRAELDIFSGPLDLLLYLIKQEEVDILEIPISHITDSYLTALKTIQMFDVNIAAEFLVMAATLMDIKSSSLLPDPIEVEETENPKDDLIHRLLEYKKFKLIASALEKMARKQAATCPCRPPKYDVQDKEIEPEAFLTDFDIWDCVSAYAEIVRQIEMKGPQHITYDDVPVAAYMEEVLELLGYEGGRKDFLSFFRSDHSRPRIIGIFLALLELLRQGKVELVQKEADRAYIAVCSAG